MLESGYARIRVNLQLHLWPDAILDLYHRNIINHVCKCIHFTARVRITYAVMNQEMRADHSHERREHDQSINVALELVKENNYFLL